MSATPTRDTPPVTTSAPLPATAAVRLGVDLKRAQHLLRLRIDAELKPLGLNAGLWSVLHELARAPGASSSELARAAFQTPQTMGSLIQKLAELGLVERSQPRGRVVANQLTGQGRVVYRQATRQLDAVMSAMLSGLTPTDRDTLSALLASMIGALGEHPEAVE